MGKMFLIFGTVAIFLTGCVVHDRGHGHRYRGNDSGWKHNGNNGNHGGYHCPPGQRKKGNC